MAKEEQILNYTYRLLAHRAYSEQEIKQKLEQRFPEHSALQAGVIQKLKDYHYLDDQAFAESWIKNRMRLNPRGRFLLERELKQKGIAATSIQTALAKIGFQEEETAQELVAHKAPQWEKLEPIKRKQKICQLLSARGFGWETIQKCLKNFSNDYS